MGVGDSAGVDDSVGVGVGVALGSLTVGVEVALGEVDAVVLGGTVGETLRCAVAGVADAGLVVPDPYTDRGRTVAEG